MFVPSINQLEERTTPATIYVDDNFKISTNTGPSGLSPGDTVTWDNGQFDQATNLTFGANAFRTIRDAVVAAASGDTIHVASGTYFESGQTVIDSGKTVTIIGAGSSRTRLIAEFNSGDENSGDLRAWFLVSSGATLNLSRLTLNASNRSVAEAVRFTTGANGGTIDGVAFQYIRLPRSTYDGIGVDVKSGSVDVLNSTFTGMGRMGVQFLNAGTTGQFSGNVYSGKGAGNWFDYAVEVGDGATATISGNTIRNCRGMSPSGFESAGILVDTAGASGTAATILSNSIFNNTNGIFVGITDGDGDTSDVVAEFNNIFGNGTGMFVTSALATVDASNNWWGSTLGPLATSNPSGKGNLVGDLVDFEPFSVRVSAVLPVTSMPEYLSLTSNFLVVGGGGDTGNPTTKVVNVDGSVRFTLNAFADLGGRYAESPVTVAIGDVTGDGIPDVVAAHGVGGSPYVRVVDGVTGAVVRRFVAPGFSSGASVAVGDVNGDGVGDIIIGAGPNVNPIVTVYSGKSGGLLRVIRAFNSFQVRGGVNVAAGDFDGDGVADIVVGQGPGNFADVRALSGRSPNVELLSFRAYDNSFLGGVRLATGDFNNDGTPDIVTAGGPGSMQLVQGFDGADASSLFAFDPGYPIDFLGGIRVAVGDLNSDGVPDIVSAPGSGNVPLVRIFDGTNQSEITNFLAFDPSSVGGVSVGVV